MSVPSTEPTVVFVSGHVVGIDSVFFDKHYATELRRWIELKAHFVVGDAAGIDKLSQQFLHENKATDVTVYHMHKKPRNNLGSWKCVGGFKNDEDRDQEMTLNSTCDLAVVDSARRIYTSEYLETKSIQELRTLLSEKRSLPPSTPMIVAPRRQGITIAVADVCDPPKRVRVTGTEKNTIRRILHNKMKELIAHYDGERDEVMRKFSYYFENCVLPPRSQAPHTQAGKDLFATVMETVSPSLKNQLKRNAEELLTDSSLKELKKQSIDKIPVATDTVFRDDYGSVPTSLLNTVHEMKNFHEMLLLTQTPPSSTSDKTWNGLVMKSLAKRRGQIRNGDLGKLAHGLNIEGGFPVMDLLKSRPRDGRWANLVVVLDRPLVDHVIFDDLKADVLKNKYPMLENGVGEIDEHQMLIAYMTILGFYMAPEQKAQTITVHVHQAPTDAVYLVGWLKDASQRLATYYSHSPKSLAGRSYQAPQIDFRTDDPFYVRQECKSDVLLSFSQCAGLFGTIPAGALLAPSSFVPFDVKSNTIHTDQTYSIVNSLLTDLPQILASPAHTFAVDHVRTFYVSANPNKREHYRAEVLRPENFMMDKITFLQVSGIWNPTSADEMVKVQ